jgi:LacI family transcriptional regulator
MPGETATIRDVAARAGVSATTVSHVLNATRHVEPATAARVRDAVEQLRYRPNALAASMRGGPTRTVGIIVPDIANPYFADLARALEDAAFERGYNAFLCNSDADESKEARYLDALLRKQVDGVVLASAGHPSERLREVVAHGPPMVIMDRALDDIGISRVIVDNHEGGRLAAEYLIGLGHRRLGVIAGPDVAPSAGRLSGFRAGLRAAGVPLPTRRIAKGDFRWGGAKTAMLELLRRDPTITAVFAENDVMAIEAMGAAQHTGLRVPADLSIVGFDDVSFSAAITPALTTVAQPVGMIASAAVDLLFERFRHPDAPSRQVVLPVSLIVRESCAPHAGR